MTYIITVSGTTIETEELPEDDGSWIFTTVSGNE